MNKSNLKTQIRNYLAGFFGILALAIFVSGCASTGQNFDESKTSQIVKGQTTEADLVGLFGQPQSRGMNSEGLTTLTWSYYEARTKGETFIPYAGMFMGGSDTSHKMLMVNLGANGTVESFNVQTGGMETRNMSQDNPE